MTTLLTFIKTILFYHHPVLTWSVRILIALNIMLAGFPMGDHGYPMVALVLTAIAYLLTEARLRLPALLPLFLASVITYIRLGM